MEREYSSASAFKTLSFAASSCKRTVSRSQTSLVLLARPGANLFKKASHESSRTAPLGDHTEGTLDFLQPLTPPCRIMSSPSPSGICDINVHRMTGQIHNAVPSTQSCKIQALNCHLASVRGYPFITLY